MATSVSDLSDTVRGQSPEALFKTASDMCVRIQRWCLAPLRLVVFALARLLQGGAWSGGRPNVRPGDSETISQSNAI
jgi:hypothetical protein